MDSISDFQKARYQYQHRLPKSLHGEFSLQESNGDAAQVLDAEIVKSFPHTTGKKPVTVTAGKDASLTNDAITVGVVLSGGPAPGGHNAIAGLFDSLKKANPASRLIGFLNGPIGVIQDVHKELTAEIIDAFRNTGGFDMIGSGRDKIESKDDIDRCVKTLNGLGARALVVIGGDDSNTNAAILAENFLARGESIQVIGLPKTIDGDMRNETIETSFGFDTAAKTYANMVANIARDARSARKYTHIVKLMGRAASHVALEVALQVQPNLTIISEEVEAKKMTLNDVVDQIVDVITRRSEAGKDYGVIVIPEGLLEFLTDFKELLREMSILFHEEEAVLNSYDTDEDKRQFVNSKLNAESSKVYSTLPDSIQHTLLKPDKHGNIPVSQIDTDYLLMDLTKLRLRELKMLGRYKGTFNPLHHFFGYEGRCVPPSNFDADYCYALGYTATQLIRAGLTGYTVFGGNMVESVDDWVMGGIPVTVMLNMELRKGNMKPVIKKALVELEGAPFKRFLENREQWIVEDAYKFVAPIQYFGPTALADSRTMTLRLEQGTL